MDFSKIFIKNACPTRIGGQAVVSGIMMRGEDRTAVVLRKKDGTLHMKTQILKKHGSLFKIPFIRGIFVFVDSLVMGTSTLMYSAQILEDDMEEEPVEGKFSAWITEKFGSKFLWNLMFWHAGATAHSTSMG